MPQNQRMVASASEKQLPHHGYKLKSSCGALNRVLSAQMSGKFSANVFAEGSSLMKAQPENIKQQLRKNRSNGVDRLSLGMPSRKIVKGITGAMGGSGVLGRRAGEIGEGRFNLYQWAAESQDLEAFGGMQGGDPYFKKDSI